MASSPPPLLATEGFLATDRFGMTAIGLGCHVHDDGGFGCIRDSAWRGFWRVVVFFVYHAHGIVPASVLASSGHDALTGMNTQKRSAQTSHVLSVLPQRCALGADSVEEIGRVHRSHRGRSVNAALINVGDPSHVRHCGVLVEVVVRVDRCRGPRPVSPRISAVDGIGVHRVGVYHHLSTNHDPPNGGSFRLFVGLRFDFYISPDWPAGQAFLSMVAC